MFLLFLFEVITILLIITTALFIHEMGHAIVVLLQDKKAKAEIYLGSYSKEKKLRVPLGRLTLYLSIAFSGLCSVSNAQELSPSSNMQRFLFLAGGPIASLLGFVSLYFISNLIPGVLGIIVNRIAFASLFIAITSSLPFTYPAFLGGLPSDGLLMFNLWKKARKKTKERTI